MISADAFDLKILAALQDDGRLTNQQLAEIVGLSASQCSRRRMRLEEDKIISGYHADLSSEALGYFLAYDWPGNVRELRNMVERLVIMAPGDVITADDLPAPLRPKEAAVPAGEARDRSLKDARDNFERAYILAELRANDWNVTRTAERLGIERSHLYRKLKAYSINPPKRDS